MKYITIALLVIIAASPVLADQVVVNSDDWRDVYTGLHYASLTGQDAFFVTDQTQAARTLPTIQDEPTLLITGRQQAVGGFRALLQARTSQIEEIQSRDPFQTNQELALRAPTENIIIVDDAYGYNALVVSTYANVRNSSVVFADIGVLDVFDEKQPEEVLVYGQIPTQLVTQLEDIITDSITNQDRFQDNFDLVERFLTFQPQESIVLSNGEFIEYQLIADNNPVIFTGREAVPDQVIEFLNEKDFQVGVLVGNALAPNARYIKDETGMSVFVKFAQGRNEQQFALDLFPLPIPNPLIQFTQAEYDPTSQQLFVTLTNPGDVPVYFTLSLQTADEEVESGDATFIDAGTYKTIALPLERPATQGEYTIIYGAYPTALELIVSGRAEISQVEIDDESEVAIRGASYDPGQEAILVEVENTGAVDAFVLVEAEDVRQGLDRVRVSSDVERINAQETETIELPIALSERDLQRNNELSLITFYGERELSLTKQTRATLGFSVSESSNYWIWIVVAVVAILALLFAIKANKKKQKPQYAHYQQWPPR